MASGASLCWRCHRIAFVRDDITGVGGSAKIAAVSAMPNSSWRPVRTLRRSRCSIGATSGWSSPTSGHGRAITKLHAIWPQRRSRPRSPVWSATIPPRACRSSGSMGIAANQLRRLWRSRRVSFAGPGADWRSKRPLLRTLDGRSSTPLTRSLMVIGSRPRCRGSRPRVVRPCAFASLNSSTMVRSPEGWTASVGPLEAWSSEGFAASVTSSTSPQVTGHDTECFLTSSSSLAANCRLPPIGASRASRSVSRPGAGDGWA